MSDLSDIQKQLGLANQRVVSLEKALREHPGYPSIAANLDSAVRVQRKLETQNKLALMEAETTVPNRAPI